MPMKAGEVLRRRGGAALLVSPGPLSSDMKRAMPAFLRFDARPFIGAVSVPALVLAGSADPIVPVARVRAIHEALPGSHFEVVEGAGHVPTAEQRPEVARAFARFAAELP
jgi:pimeloyl-ACP methyl ester carboxylesterase